MLFQVTNWFTKSLNYQYDPLMHGNVAEWLSDLISISFTEPPKYFKRSMRSIKVPQHPLLYCPSTNLPPGGEVSIYLSNLGQAVTQQHKGAGSSTCDVAPSRLADVGITAQLQQGAQEAGSRRSGIKQRARRCRTWTRQRRALPRSSPRWGSLRQRRSR